jgi:malic enzyme
LVSCEFTRLGTASVIVAGLLSCARLLQRKMSQTRYLFFGAGSAGIGIAEMCLDQMKSEGLTQKEADDLIYMVNSQGIVTKHT